MLNHPCASGLRPTWSWCIIFLIYCCVQFSSTFFRIFASVFMRDIGPYFSFLRVMFPRFWSQGNIGLIKWVGKYGLLFDFLEEFEENRYEIFFECLVEFTGEAIWSWTFTFGRFLMIVSISILLIGLFRFSRSSWFSLGRLYFSKYWSISPRLFNLLLYTFS